MKRASKLLRLLPAVLALSLSAPALAEVPRPEIPEAVKGEQCVEPTDVMRRKHMDYLKHHRDDALRRGIRTEKYSLKECIACHVAPEEQTQAAPKNEGHFCMNCHEYAGVHIDCFQCHATQPEKSARFHPLVTPSMKALKDVHQPDSIELLNQFAAMKSATGVVQ